MKSFDKTFLFLLAVMVAAAGIMSCSDSKSTPWVSPDDLFVENSALYLALDSKSQLDALDLFYGEEGEPEEAFFVTGYRNGAISATEAYRTPLAIADIEYAKAITSSATMSFWIKQEIERADGDAVIMGDFKLYYAESHWYMYGNYGDDFVHWGTTANNMEWNHIGCVFDGDDCTLYVNGQKVKTEAFTVFDYDNMRNLAFLNYSYSTGAMDEFRMFNRALSDTEMSALYAAEFNVNNN